MHIALDAIGFLPYDQNDLGMGLQSHQSVNNVAAGLFQTSGPDDIIFFVKTRLEFY